MVMGLSRPSVVKSVDVALDHLERRRMGMPTNPMARLQHDVARAYERDKERRKGR